MKMLNTKQEIATAINSHKTTVVRIDLADADDYGLKSQPILIDNGTFRDGFPYLIRSKIRAFTDERKFTFCSGCTCLSNSFGYHDMEELLTYANALIVKPDSDVILAIVDSKKRQAYKPIIMHTAKRINQHCSTPLTFVDEDNDATMFLLSAGCELSYK